MILQQAPENKHKLRFRGKNLLVGVKFLLANLRVFFNVLVVLPRRTVGCSRQVHRCNRKFSCRSYNAIL